MSERLAGKRSACTDSVANGQEISIRIHDRIAPIAVLWDSIVPSGDPYWSSSFLSNIERQPPGEYGFRYMIFYRDERPIGVAYAQLTEFSAWQSIRGDIREGERRGMSLFRNWLAKKLRLNVLIMGNTLVSGPYAYYFRPGVDTDPSLIREATDRLVQSLEKDGVSIHLVAVKDLDPAIAETWNGQHHTWRQVCFQPRMVLRIPDTWKTEQDYLEAMQSKYRVRYRRARKKLAGIDSRRLDPEGLYHFRDRMYECYLSVAEQSGFNMVELDKDYWLRLKELFGEQFSVRAYFRGDRLVGFYSMLRGDHDIWHANYLGYDQTVNRDHQLYLNMLYDMVVSAIQGEAKVLDFSRTALEIKSSVGAEPEDLYCYFHHRSPLVNPFIPWITQVIAPVEEWAQRHPFRSGDTDQDSELNG